MATLTVTIDPAVLEVAQREAERRQMTLDAFIAESLSNLSAPTPADDFGHAELVELMARAPLGQMGKPLTRDEIYAERTWTPA